MAARLFISIAKMQRGCHGADLALCQKFGEKGGFVARKYGAKAQKKVERAMHEKKRGTLRSGRSGKKVTSRKQAIAIGLSEARKKGAKVPRRSSASR
jgi:hypothetical protein